jgi:acetoin utilization protein AcuB
MTDLCNETAKHFISDLASLKVRSVMTPTPLTIDEDTDLVTARRILRDKNIRHLPVVHRGKLSGILSERDTRLVSFMTEISKMAVADIMSREPLAVNEETPVLEAVAKMAEGKYGCAIVQDGTGAISGIFTSQDALRLMLGEQKFRTPPPAPYPPAEDDDDEWL